MTSLMMPKNGSAMMSTSGRPKNQNGCCQWMAPLFSRSKRVLQPRLPAPFGSRMSPINYKNIGVPTPESGQRNPPRSGGLQSGASPRRAAPKGPCRLHGAAISLASSPIGACCVRAHQIPNRMPIPDTRNAVTVEGDFGTDSRRDAGGR